MIQMFKKERMWRSYELDDTYDVVIIGAGIHGLATAYYLAKQGITNIAVVDRWYMGSGGSCRNTAIIRSNYRTPEGIAFYNESVKIYEQLGAELNFNLLFSQQGHMTLAHNNTGVNGLRVRAENNELLGVDSRITWPDEIQRLVPAMDVGKTSRYPILAALFHPPGGIIRHDAVVWGYARAADRLGVQIHPLTEVQDIDVEHGRVAGVHTSRGIIKTRTVVNATAGWCSTISKMVGVDLPVVTHPLQALVTEPLKPFLDKIIVSATLHLYISQSDRGELVIGEEINPYSSYSSRSTLPFLEQAASHVLELFPCLKEVRILRQWAGLCDMTPDFSPIISTVDEVEGYVVEVGWGTYGFKAGPIAGKMTAELIATGRTPDLIYPFRLSRFREEALVGEKAAAVVSH